MNHGYHNGFDSIADADAEYIADANATTYVGAHPRLLDVLANFV